MKSFSIKSVFAILLVVSFAACTAIFEDGKELAGAFRKDISEMPADTLKKMIENGEEFLLIDIRQPADYEAGNIPGSFNIPRGEIEFLISDEIFWEEQYMYAPLKEDRIVIYCKAGDRGILTAKSLQKLGFTNVINLKGGYTAFAGENAPAAKKVDSGGCGG